MYARTSQRNIIIKNEIIREESFQQFPPVKPKKEYVTVFDAVPKGALGRCAFKK